MCPKGVEVRTKPMPTTQLKMEDAYNLCNVIEFFCLRKVTKTKRGGPSGPFKLQMALAQLYKNMSTCLCKFTNTSTTKGKELISGVLVVIAPFFCLSYIRSNKYLGGSMTHSQVPS